MLEGLIVILLVVGYFFFRWWLTRTWDLGAPYEGMDPDVVERILKIADVGPNDVFYDLGSGDGRVAIGAALKGAKAVGVEIDPLRVFYSRLWIKVLGLEKKVRIIKGDLFKQDIGDATVVCIYLIPETHKKLEKRLVSMLKKVSKIVAVGFECNGWEPDKVDPRGVRYGPIYLYRI